MTNTSCMQLLILEEKNSWVICILEKKCLFENIECQTGAAAENSGESTEKE